MIMYAALSTIMQQCCCMMSAALVPAHAQWLTPPATKAILRYMVKYQASRMDRTFSALADPTRRAVLLRLKAKPGLSVSELARPFSLKLPGMMKHLDVLSDAGLITRKKTGRTVSVHLSVRPMREAMEWLKRYERLWTVSIDRLVALVEKDGA
jgi:DNA-binding transcriptional ArsR family regulator